MKYLALILILSLALPAHAQIKRIWLTHASGDPSSIVVNWYSNSRGNPEVFFRAGDRKERRVAGRTTDGLHSATIPLEHTDVAYRYRVSTGDEVSETYTFKGYPSAQNALRVAVAGNWGYAEAPDLSQLKKDDPHLLLTLGDNVPNLHELCGEGKKDCILPFLKLIDSEPELFQRTPLMPVLGNHDREIRPRGNQYPPVAVYDTLATAYKKFFSLPDKEWIWKFSIPDFNVAFVALDLSHLTDLGTTWQTSHTYRTGGEQFKWYQRVMKKPADITITLLNERNERTRNLEGTQWKDLLEKGTAVISGYGYYSERADVEGFPYFTTSLKAGDEYPDAHSDFFEGAAGYMLLTFQKDKRPRFEVKRLDGTVMDVWIFPGED